MKEPIKLPEKFLKPQKQFVRDMPVGGEGYVGGGQLRVGPDLSVYLRARATLEKNTFVCMKVKREEDGFVVWLSSTTTRYIALPHSILISSSCRSSALRSGRRSFETTGRLSLK